MRTRLLATTSAIFLAGCGDPLDDVEKLSDVKLADDQPVREAVASPEEMHRADGGLGGLTPDPEGSALADTAGDAAGQTPAGSSERRGFLARLFNPDRTGSSGSDTTVQVATRGRNASVAHQTAQPQRSLARYARGGASRRSVRLPGVAEDVRYGTFLPFATVGRVCDARSRSKGRRIEVSDAGYTLYDSAPRATGPRTFYITGFADGCPRQFTAALAMFGAPAMHEQLRYGRPSDQYPYSDTDTAYEKVKSAICRVGRRKPCGTRIGSLERNTVFISTYERFSHNGRWADILVHDGAVLAASLKDL